MSSHGWETLSTRERRGTTTLATAANDITVDAKTARNGRELILRVHGQGRLAHLLLDPKSLALVAMTVGPSDEESWTAMQAVRREMMPAG
jgi:hypothetical protein